MLEITIPGYKQLQLHHLVLDFNGTLACDGSLLVGVKPLLRALSENLKIHVVTADTFGNANTALVGLPCKLSVLSEANQDAGKLAYVENLPADHTVCIGNGRNDRLMLEAAALGIVVMQAECAALNTVLAADVIAPDIVSALKLLSNPLRLIATLRS